MRKIKQLIVHCSATRPNMDIGVDQIRTWHVEERGWSDVGYHYVIKRNGSIEKGRDEEVAGAHAKGFNQTSIGICLIGGLDRDGKPSANYTFAQYCSLHFILDELKDAFPDAVIMGHRDLAGVYKDCPCFDVKDFYVKGVLDGNTH